MFRTACTAPRTDTRRTWQRCDVPGLAIRRQTWSCAKLERTASIRDLPDKDALLWQCQPILSGQNPVLQVSERIVCNCLVALRAEDQPNWRVLVGTGPVLSGVIEVQIHLASVSVGEAAEFQIYENQTPKAAMEEEQVHTVPVVPNPEPLLPGHEGEVVAKFQAGNAPGAGSTPPPVRAPNTRLSNREIRARTGPGCVRRA